MFRFARPQSLWLLVGAVCCAPALSDVVVDYTVPAGGSNQNPLNGLSARATASLTAGGTGLRIVLQNTSTGLPDGFDANASLLVSLGMNLGVDFASLDSASISPGSRGVGAWSRLGAGAPLVDAWATSNGGAAGLPGSYAQVLSADLAGMAQIARFWPDQFGGSLTGIAADPVLKHIPRYQRAVSDSVLFEFTLETGITEAELRAALQGSVVEFGSDDQFLTPPNVVIPAPGAAVLAALGLAALRRVAR